MFEQVNWKEKELDLIAVGRAGVDFNPMEPNRSFSKTTTFLKSMGGSPANIVAAYARLGGKAGFVGRVSNDAVGDYILDEFRNFGVDTGGTVVDDQGAVNCLAIVEIRQPDDCTSYLYRDNVADMNLCSADIDEDYIKKAKAVLISGTALSREPSRGAVMKIVEYAKKHGTALAIDFDYRKAAWPSEKEASEQYNRIAEQCDILIGNREEFNVVELTALEGNRDDRVSADYWLAKGNKLVVIKRGEAGSCAYTNGNEVPCGVFKVQIKKTQGSGDAYAAGLMFGILNGMDLKKSLELGSACAAIVLQNLTCSAASPDWNQVQKFIKTFSA